ncbi:hypothetical protein OH76DRAFT_262105 [Lentinus brumalis]|uniref:Uncharacterized protein n=1 Tax=Lentinus brumalis TaxID=2498619 RepID=A0A371DGI8_9APHY|nr:hypothetical protein OH76DRAFT_262105 [Polyporus brumalis]
MRMLPMYSIDGRVQKTRRASNVQDALLCLPLHDDRPVLMEIDQCTARLEDEQTRCSSRPAATSGICSTHLRERDRSVKEYKVVSSRADALKGEAIVSKRQLVALKTPRDIQEAIKATEAYREVLQEEAERRVTHAKRFYSDDPVDHSNGHHVRIRRLSGRIDICGVFLVKLRELEQQQVEDGMRSRRRSASKGKGWSSWYEGDREPEDSARHAAEEQQRAHAENRKLAETRRSALGGKLGAIEASMAKVGLVLRSSCS